MTQPLGGGAENVSGGVSTGPMTFDESANTASGGSDYLDQYLSCGTDWKTIDVGVRRTDVDPPVVVATFKFSFKCVDYPNTVP